MAACGGQSAAEACSVIRTVAAAASILPLAVVCAALAVVCAVPALVAALSAVDCAFAALAMPVLAVVCAPSAVPCAATAAAAACIAASLASWSTPPIPPEGTGVSVIVRGSKVCRAEFPESTRSATAASYRYGAAR